VKLLSLSNPVEYLNNLGAVSAWPRNGSGAIYGQSVSSKRLSIGIKDKPLLLFVLFKSQIQKAEIYTYFKTCFEVSAHP
jgi:hypothetical protein